MNAGIRRDGELPFPLRFPLAFDGKVLGQVLRIFTDTVSGWYRQRHVALIAVRGEAAKGGGELGNGGVLPRQ